MPIQVKFSKSKNPKKKYMAVFTDKDGKKTKTTHFGAAGMSDFTKNKDEKRKSSYLARHKTTENWNNYESAGALSRWVLWNKTSLSASIASYKKKFNLS